MSGAGIRHTRDNDEELRRIAGYLAGVRAPEKAARLYSDIEEMKNQMAAGICHFTFVKVNGERRDAYGTRDRDIIGRHSDMAAATPRKGGAFNGTFPYFDLARRDWRCFRVDTLVGLDRDYVL